jgi:hypothetical protein
MWDKRVVEYMEEAKGFFSISYKFKSILDQFVLAFSGVHGPNADSSRHFFWEGAIRGFQLAGNSFKFTSAISRVC